MKGATRASARKASFRELPELEDLSMTHEYDDLDLYDSDPL